MPAQVKEILTYFLRHPQAADSLEGVVRWRLPQERVRRGMEEIEEALGWLVSKQFLSQVSAAGTPPIYRLNEEKRAAAERLLPPTAHSRSKRKR